MELIFNDFEAGKSITQAIGTFIRYKITINVPVVYMARDEMMLMWAISITRGIGRGGPWKSRLFLGPKWHSLRFPGPTPSNGPRN